MEEHGTASHWKYIIDNVIVYRDVYRGIEKEKMIIEGMAGVTANASVV